MLSATTTYPQITREEVHRLCGGRGDRLHWAVLTSIGLRAEDVIHSPRDLDIYHTICVQIGNRWTPIDTDANIVIHFRPPEALLISQVNRIKPGDRIISFNKEYELEDLEMKTFDLATACFFDSETKMIARFFDYLQAKRKGDYLHIEMNECSDSSLALHASRIAALR